MTSTLYYGQPGTGKSTIATGLALDYMREGRRVVANYPIDPAPAVLHHSDPIVNAWAEVIPSRPSLADLIALGFGWMQPEHHGREELAGLLIIDEAGPWLSARQWNGPERNDLIDWLMHIRKNGWDLVLIAQTPNMIDKHARDGVIELYARCRRMDRQKVVGFNLPRIHMAVIRYGINEMAPFIERKIYRGTTEHKCFQSYALFNTGIQEEAWYSTLPPRLTTYKDKKKGGLNMKSIIISVLIVGGLLGFGLGKYTSPEPVQVAQAEQVTPAAKPENPTFTVSEGKSSPLSAPSMPEISLEPEPVKLSGCATWESGCKCLNTNGEDAGLSQDQCLAYLGRVSLPEASKAEGEGQGLPSAPARAGGVAPDLHDVNLFEKTYPPKNTGATVSRLVNGQWESHPL